MTKTSMAPYETCSRLRVAIMHDWLLGMRGGEWLLEALLKLFSNARLYTLFYRPDRMLPSINKHAIKPSCLSYLPGVTRYYRHLLPILPWAVEHLRIDDAPEIVLSLSHCVAHGIFAPKTSQSIRINYYFSPMRYLYDQQASYVRQGGLTAWALKRWTPSLRKWDYQAAHRANVVWAISEFVADRIRNAYGFDETRPVEVIYPPVRTEYYTPSDKERCNEYLAVSALTPYKQLEVVIHAANRLGYRLRVVGNGPLLKELCKIAGPTVTMEGWVDQERLRMLYRTCKALIYSAEEDFGIVPVEAMACGMPILGLGRGGLCETVCEGLCGELFPSIDILEDSWREFNPSLYGQKMIRQHAEQFSESVFIRKISSKIHSLTQKSRYLDF